MSVTTQRLWQAKLRLSPSELLVLARLSCFASEDGSNIYPSMARVADEINLSLRSVRRIVAGLEAAGYLSVVTPSKGGRGRTTCYRLNLPGGEPVETVSNVTPFPAGKTVSDTALFGLINSGTSITVSDKTVSPMVINSVTGDTRIKREPEKKVREDKSSLFRADFDEWYAAYPRKRDPGDALKAYIRARESGVSRETLLVAVHGYAAERSGHDPKFTKHPATWLNKRSWQNEKELPHVEQRDNLPAQPKFKNGALAALHRLSGSGMFGPDNA